MARPVVYTYSVDEVATAARHNTDIRDAFKYVLGDEASQDSIIYGTDLEIVNTAGTFGIRKERDGGSPQTQWFRIYSWLSGTMGDGDGVLLNLGTQDGSGLKDWGKIIAQRWDPGRGEVKIVALESTGHATSTPGVYIGKGGTAVRRTNPGIGPAVFTGSGLDDMTTDGEWDFSTFPDTPHEYRVEIDGTGSPDTFRWSDDGGATWDATGVSITGSDQTLNNGVTIRFTATTGHTSADRWDFGAGMRLSVGGAIDATEILKNGMPFSGGQWGTSGSDIYYSSGQVAIGRTSASDTLDVDGTARFRGLVKAIVALAVGRDTATEDLDVNNNAIIRGQLKAHAASGAPIDTDGNYNLCDLNVEQLEGYGWKVAEVEVDLAITHGSSWATKDTFSLNRLGEYVIVDVATVEVDTSDGGALFESRLNLSGGTATVTQLQGIYESQDDGDKGVMISIAKVDVTVATATVQFQTQKTGGSGSSGGGHLGFALWTGP